MRADGHRVGNVHGEDLVTVQIDAHARLQLVVESEARRYLGGDEGGAEQPHLLVGLDPFSSRVGSPVRVVELGKHEVRERGLIRQRHAPGGRAEGDEAPQVEGEIRVELVAGCDLNAVDAHFDDELVLREEGDGVVVGRQLEELRDHGGEGVRVVDEGDAENSSRESEAGQ